MSAERLFADTNVLCYLFEGDAHKATRSSDILQSGVIISTQVLAEFTNVARKKAKLDWDEIDEFIQAICSTCQIVPVTLSIFLTAQRLARADRIPIFDAQIIAAALENGATKLISEDFQHGRVFDGQLQVQNPFL
jgi:predicted nucleic acid-binding protein